MEQAVGEHQACWQGSSAVAQPLRYSGGEVGAGAGTTDVEMCRVAEQVGCDEERREDIVGRNRIAHTVEDLAIVD